MANLIKIDITNKNKKKKDFKLVSNSLLSRVKVNFKLNFFHNNSRLNNETTVKFLKMHCKFLYNQRVKRTLKGLINHSYNLIANTEDYKLCQHHQSGNIKNTFSARSDCRIETSPPAFSSRMERDFVLVH